MRLGFDKILKAFTEVTQPGNEVTRGSLGELLAHEMKHKIGRNAVTQRLRVARRLFKT